MSTVFYNGDSSVLGNLNLVQNLSVSGPFILKNIVGNTLTTQSVGVGTSLNLTSLVVTSLTTLPSLVNVYASNSLSTPNVSAGTMNCAYFTVGYSPGFFVTNITLSDTLVTANVSSQSMNTINLNLNSLFTSSFCVATSAPGATLQVQGNLTSTDSFTGNALTTGTMNIAGTINASILNYSQIVTGNIVNIPDVINSGITSTANNLIYTVEDLSRRSPHLAPTPGNSVQIQAWISGTCKNGWWPPFALANVASVGSLQYSGSVLLPDGTVLFVPWNSGGTIGRFNPMTGQFTAVTPSGDKPSGSFIGGVLLPTGNVVFIPSSSYFIGMYNPVSNQFWNALPNTTSGYVGGTLDPYGNVIMIPGVGNSRIGKYNPSQGTISLINIGGDGGDAQGSVLLPNGNIIIVPARCPSLYQYQAATGLVTRLYIIGGQALKFCGGVLAPNGSVICVPASSNIGIWAPDSSTFSNVSIGTPSGAFSGGCLLPNGNVIFVPQTSSNVGMFDPASRAYSNIFLGGSFSGGTLIRDGRVILCPRGSGNVVALETGTPISREFCLSPYFNKF
jgi:streptogramin lyase